MRDTFRTHRVLSVVASLFAICLANQSARAQYVGMPPVGAGLSGVSDWNRTHEFADISRQARPWGSPSDPWLGQADISLDANNWPTEDAGLVVMCCQPSGLNLGGVYKISFECNTLPQVRALVSTGTIQNLQRNSTTGVVTADLIVPANPEAIYLSFTETQGGVRNLKVMRPGSHASDTFTPLFIEKNSRFNVIRFMDWTRTNGSPIQRWDERNTAQGSNWRDGSGIPYEVCIDLCNQLGRDIWLNVPHKADDDFVRQMARLVRDRLDPQLNVYIEYSNETWNFLFPQADWIHEQSVAECTSGPSDLNYDNSGDENNWRWRFHARRTVQVGQIFAQEFGPGSMNGRVRPILAGQFSRPHMYDVMVRYIESVWGRPNDYVYAISGAPYFMLGSIDSNRTDLSVDEILDALEVSVSRWEQDPSLERLAALTAWYNLAPMTAYEGGPDTAGPNNLPNKRLAYYDQRMKIMCQRYLRHWFASGGGQFQWFTSGAQNWLSPYGAYSLVERMDDMNTPKLLAVDEIANAPAPALSAGYSLPGSFETRRHVRREPGWDNLPTPLLGPGSSLEYLVNSRTTQTYEVYLEAAGFASLTPVQVFIDSNLLGTINVTNTGSSANEVYRWFGPLTLQVPAGLSTIRFAPVNANYQMRMRTVRVATTCDSVDFNNDGMFFDPTDIDAFMSVYSEGPCVPAQASCNDVDFNNDGSSFDMSDIDAFLRVFSEGPCW
jgi:hypothetical protein